MKSKTINDRAIAYARRSHCNTLITQRVVRAWTSGYWRGRQYSTASIEALTRDLIDEKHIHAIDRQQLDIAQIAVSAARNALKKRDVEIAELKKQLALATSALSNELAVPQ